jgi:hypothetical protein
MKGNVFDNFQKAWTSLMRLLNFGKISCDPPFSKPRVGQVLSGNYFSLFNGRGFYSLSGKQINF